MLYHKTFPIDAVAPAAAADAPTPPVTDSEVKETLAWLAAGGTQGGGQAGGSTYPLAPSLVSLGR